MSAGCYREDRVSTENMHFTTGISPLRIGYIRALICWTVPIFRRDHVKVCLLVSRKNYSNRHSYDLHVLANHTV